MALNKEETTGIIATAGFHLVLVLIAYLYVVDPAPNERAAFIEVTLGDFSSGTQSQYAPKQSDRAKTAINPSQQEVKDEVEKPNNETEAVQAEKEAKDVDLPDQQQQVESETKTNSPDTDIKDPTAIPSEKTKEEKKVESKAKKADEKNDGEKESGTEKGNVGRTDSDQGKGEDKDKSAPYELKWEGDIQRSPIVQPLPAFTENIEAKVTIRFEVQPNGSVGRIIPLRKSGNASIDNEVLKTIRSWRFSALPSSVPQQAQWGTITFRFVFR